ncbi:precorrin-6y C5,15-methyltransferase (decarboxylating) subunit CbiE [Desulforamulus hydrothermalis]|uniref:Precorrin-6y C5,15-methyltransferase (Decarboxylating), CbiE subunit n=1 Tax=Desulforamulus hydrothermalis Lam5 = DSM 18033 TaxID=1121428 RepID=K8DYK6_9FIRM|nr:precorrin-6y C5,15-methyltransferase (decarboxylating) subunit CbiE [Desulforamulus hydrothermalis]CCO07982.1 Precorrin-6y C5,15-methyltransferase (Decarboxylating), CbiE subunit [Desulforamulus hydrothermalis Lam5 = DSM 18033]SHG84842.1 precorrin-6Y C5,15-methyltransferase (decarboxylating) [Desulforamulus hydrothermalis Lam5 = DSM 18033]
MAKRIKVIGAGPGSPDYLTPAGAAALQQAEVLVGARRLLQAFARPDQEVFALGADLEEAVAFIRRSYETKQVAVLVSGDTGLYSFAAYLANCFPAASLEFIPGISSLQLMFARLKQPWQDAVVLSCHGRNDRRLLAAVQAGWPVAVLTDNHNTPQTLAARLLAAGCTDLPVSVGCNLSYPAELLYRGTLSALAKAEQKFLNCVVVIGV